MLTLRDDSEGVWVKHRYRGSEIELKIRPAGLDRIESIRRRHKRIEYVKDPQSRQLTKVEVFDEDAIFLDLVDYLLEDFRGIGTAPDKPLPATKENKKKVLLISPLQGEQPLFDFVLEKAKELETLAQEEIEAELKN